MRYVKYVQIVLLLWLGCADFLPKCLVNADYELGDPYEILRIDRKSSPQDIRRAYKSLAKEW